MNKEGDIDEFIDVLISKKPGDPKSIQLEFDNINTNVKDNNNVEGFTNYDSSLISSDTKIPNRIYNIHNSPYNESASSYYEKNHS